MLASDTCTKSAITAPQSRAARALLGWSLDDLAKASSISKRALISFERGETAPRSATASAIRAAFEAAGVDLIPENGGGVGVRLKRPSA
ncbi:MAG TPA: helix-turn-helix transcriptional regulator [Acidocella sp.]|nr:helix-turn-helix transcriptional regulator [Acidocella sp.]